MRESFFVVQLKGNLRYLNSFSYFFKRLGRYCYLNINVDSIQLEKKNEIQLYRLIKEIINNIIKHASASTTELTINATSEFMTITITHNGKGLTNEMMHQLAESSDGIGLKSILSRAQLTNSVLQYILIGNKESKIIIETPLVII